MILQVSRFAGDPPPVRGCVTWRWRAEQVGFSGLALMDHLIQIPQVGRAWEPIPEPWVSLGFLAGLDTGLRLGTLVSPVTFRDPGIIAKTVATFDTVSGGRAFCGLGAGWWAREHAAYGWPPDQPGAARPAQVHRDDPARVLVQARCGCRTTGARRRRIAPQYAPKM